MDYNEFERLYRETPVIFYLGMELFAENGSDKISASTDQELCAAVTKKLVSFFADNKSMEVVEAAKGFAGMNTVDRLIYASRCGIKLEDGPIDEPEVCPICGGTLCYGEPKITDELHEQNWTCEKCGATGKEAYRMIFDCHYHVRDSEGHPADRRTQK